MEKQPVLRNLVETIERSLTGSDESLVIELDGGGHGFPSQETCLSEDVQECSTNIRQAMERLRLIFGVR